MCTVEILLYLSYTVCYSLYMNIIFSSKEDNDVAERSLDVTPFCAISSMIFPMEKFTESTSREKPQSLLFHIILTIVTIAEMVYMIISSTIYVHYMEVVPTAYLCSHYST